MAKKNLLVCMVLASSAISMTGSMAGCEVGECRKDDAGECVDLFPDSGRFDRDADDDDEDAASDDRDGGVDARTGDAANDDAANADGGTADGGTADGATPDASNNEPLTLEQFCQAIYEPGLAWANKLDECCISTEANSTTASNIKGLFFGYTDEIVDQCIMANMARIAAGTLRYVDASGGACAAALRAYYPLPPDACPAAGFEYQALLSTVGHGAQLLTQIPVCKDALQGLVANGKACTRDADCGKGYACQPGSSGANNCLPQGDAGDSCEDVNDCAFGFVCIGSSTVGGKSCVDADQLAESGSCSASRECVEGKVCSSGSCRAPVAEAPICVQ